MTPARKNDEKKINAGESVTRRRQGRRARSLRVFSLTTATLLLSAAATVRAGVRDPFAPGFSMGTLGSIVDEKGPSGREPWTSASRCGDSSGFGFALSGVSYYGSAGAASDPEGLTQAFGGGWYTGKKIICKASIAYFRALGVYYEQSATVSAGAALLPFLRLSIEAAGYRTGVALPENPTCSIGEAGLSAWASWSWAALSFQLEHLVIASAKTAGADPPLTIRSGIHASRNEFGGQGALVTIVPGEQKPVCFTVGEEYRITKAIAVQAAFSNNPVLLSFGMSFALGRDAELGFALINHPVLGWSQGCAAQYHRIRSGGADGE